MSIATELTRLSGNVSELSQSKNAIETAITEKGGTVPAGSKLSDLPDAIDTIPVGLTASDLDGNGARKDFYKLFAECITLTTIPQLNTSNGTNFESMFFVCSALTTIPQLDTSNGTNFNSMFSRCSALTTIPQLDTSNGTNFGSMFSSCSALTTIPQLDTSNGTIFSTMFNSCSALTTIPQLDTSNGTNFGTMFSSCSALTTIPKINLSKATYISLMFNSCKELKNITFEGQIKITGLVLSDSKNLTIESLRSMINALEPKTSGTFKVSIGSTNYAKLTENDIQQIAEKGWTVQ